MTAEVDLFGIFIPTPIVLGVLAYVAKAGLSRLLARWPFGRRMHGQPVFEVAMFLVLFAALVRATTFLNP
ncbi:MAG: hypothetical protein BGO12_21270 [Verrucomicrobia bacterium 61-8]|nr:DUF1656 domain-containing protein [Verrucomicrobiota bacterium]OJU99027.1 MAG: hypothetical protein BGO12_21270 [Verrucomicrobia bacterium 61-8]